jgi:hypothetical protein
MKPAPDRSTCIEPAPCGRKGRSAASRKALSLQNGNRQASAGKKGAGGKSADAGTDHHDMTVTHIPTAFFCRQGRRFSG